MIKKALTLLFLITLLLITTPQTFASAFSVNKIGSVDLKGKSYKHIWYTGSKPAFSGTSDAGASVNVTIDSKTQSTSADGSGNWSSTPTTTLSDGDHQMQIDSNGHSYLFTLTIGKDVPANVFGDPSKLPVTGDSLTTALAVLIGVACFAVGMVGIKGRKV